LKKFLTTENCLFDFVSNLADGSSMAGELALENKLIDYLGDKETIRMLFAKELDLPTDEVIFCD
jgi:ClpP class serine protease